MNRTAIIASTLTVCTLVGALFVQPPQAAARSSSPDTAAPMPDLRPLAANGNLLCGLSLGDVADIIDYYNFTPDMQALAAALSTPFDCEAYGELCTELDLADAYQFVCGTWNDMKMATPLPNLIDNIRVRLDEFGIGTCEPTPQNCAAACQGQPVIYCTGMRFNGRCYPTPNCGGDFDGGTGFPIFDDIVSG